MDILDVLSLSMSFWKRFGFYSNFEFFEWFNGYCYFRNAPDHRRSLSRTECSFGPTAANAVNRRCVSADELTASAPVRNKFEFNISFFVLSILDVFYFFGRLHVTTTLSTSENTRLNSFPDNIMVRQNGFFFSGHQHFNCYNSCVFAV